MAHMQKFKRSAATHIIGHCERERGKEGYLKYNNNSYIDEEKTPLNYAYISCGHSRLKGRLNEIAPNRRKDAVTMVDWVITLPEQLKDSSESEQQKFFDTAESFLENRYGRKNVVCSTVHLDETSPHLHFCFVPVVTDKKTGKEKLCCKELMTKAELNRFHKELDNKMAEVFNAKGLILTGVTKEAGGNKSIAQLKAETLATAAETIKNELQDFQDELNAKIGDFRSNIFSSLMAPNQSVKAALTDFRNRYYFEGIKEKRGGLFIPDNLLEQYFKELPLLSQQDILSKGWNSFITAMNTFAEFEPLERYQQIKRLQQQAVRDQTAAEKNKQNYERLYNSQLNLNETFQLLQKKQAETEKENARLKKAEEELLQEQKSLQDILEHQAKQLDNAMVKEKYYEYHYEPVSLEKAQQFELELQRHNEQQQRNNLQKTKSTTRQLHRQRDDEFEL